MRTLWLAILAAPTAAACMNDVQVVHQNGIVPRPRANDYDAQPMTNGVEFSGHAQTVLQSPTTASTQTESGADVAKTQFGVAVRFPTSENGDIAATFDGAVASNAVPVAQNPVAAPNTSGAFALGLAVHHSWAASDDGLTRFGLTVGGQLWMVPIATDATTSETGVGDESNSVCPVVSVGATVSHTAGPVTFFGSLTGVSQIDVPAAYTITDGQQSSASGAQMADPAVVFAAGARFALGDQGALIVQASDTANALGGDVPMIGATLAVSTGAKRSAAATAVAPTTYGPVYPGQ